MMNLSNRQGEMFLINISLIISQVWAFVSLDVDIWVENAFLTGSKNILDTGCAIVSILMVAMILSQKR